MNILEIYKKYQIMPQLAEHQLRVAAVAEIICSHISVPVNKHDVVVACLLHDMGNIVKFNFSETTKEMVGEEVYGQLDYWERVKREFLEKYGVGSHNATNKIVEELGLGERVRELVNSVGFHQGIKNAAGNDFEKKVCTYSDMRVMPLGVGLLEDRLADLRRRYKNHQEGSGERDSFEIALREIEGQIFEHCSIKPDDIAEAAIAERKEQLKSFEV
jgi:hypothetical protein